MPGRLRNQRHQRQRIVLRRAQCPLEIEIHRDRLVIVRHEQRVLEQQTVEAGAFQRLGQFDLQVGLRPPAHPRRPRAGSSHGRRSCCRETSRDGIAVPPRASLSAVAPSGDAIGGPARASGLTQCDSHGRATPVALILWLIGTKLERWFTLELRAPLRSFADAD